MKKFYVDIYKMDSGNLLSLALGLGYIGSLLAINKVVSEEKNVEKFEDTYPAPPVFYSKDQAKINAAYAMNQGNRSGNYQMINKFVGPDANVPQNQSTINLNSSGDQMLDYQLYQQAVNAATPTIQQLQAISGESQQQTGNDSPLRGGVSSDYAPYNLLAGTGPENYVSEFQAVNGLGNKQAEAISACAQNAPQFVSTSLLPKPSVPGEESWDISAPQNILATQNFLSATQQLGVDTVLSSNKNPSYDIRGDIPNPINVVSPWNQTSITADLERRPLSCFVPQDGLYGCGAPSVGANMDGTYVGYDN